MLEIRKVLNEEMKDALNLVWRVFLEYEAPDYTDEALEILKSKRKGTYNIIKIDKNYVPANLEKKQVYGITFEQGRNELEINNDML